VKLTHVTFTGVDHQTSLPQLISLATRYPLSEWGFLYSPKRQSMPGRYPSVGALQSALLYLSPKVRVALHICGAGVTDLLAGEQTVTELVDLVQQRSGRVQLNFNLADRPGEKSSRKPDLDLLRCFVASRQSLTVITQHHHANLAVHEALRQYVNHAVLFDTSGGNGGTPAEWPKPLSGTACGYAGGLGPETIGQALPEIATACVDASIWVDMEGRLRTVDDVGDDWLSLDRCEQVLAKVPRHLYWQGVA